MKKTIRINESQLKDLVETILKELDDRTYAHAAQMAGRDYNYYKGIAGDDKYQSPLTRTRANQQAKRKQRQQNAFIGRLNQGVNKNLGLPSNKKMFNKDNINGEDYQNVCYPFDDRSQKGKYMTNMHHFFKGNAYYNEPYGQWLNDPYSVDVDNFKKDADKKHPIPQTESIVRNITENVIRKLRNFK